MKSILVICLVLVPFGAFAQKKNSKKAPVNNTTDQKSTLATVNKGAGDTVRTSMRMIAQNYGDSIVVRWAPGDAVAWLLLQKPGYVLRRTVLSINTRNEYVVVDSSTLHVKPWILQEWANYFKATNDTMVAAAAQLAFGKSNEFLNNKDGNTINQLIEKYEEQKNRFTFALLLSDFKPGVATGFGFRYVEKGVKKDLHYLFSVVPAPADEPLISDTGRALIKGSEIFKKDTASNVSTIAGDKVIFLFWHNPPKYKSSFSGYFIERSEDGKIFKRLNTLPYLPQVKEGEENKPFQFADSVYINYKKFHYRIVGVNAFGDYSHPSNIAVAMATDLTGPVPPVITEIKNIKGESKIHLKWEKKNKEADFKGYVVGRSNTIEGPYDPLTTALMNTQITEFTDNNPIGGVPNYYIVAAVDTAGNASHSLPAYVQLEDLTPPAKPSGLKGNIDTLGRVTIRWDLGKEADLAGYKLFFSNSPDHIFTPLTGEMYEDTMYVDSIVLRTLTRKIYYRVIAYDRAMNASQASDMLELSKPDFVAPSAAVIHGFLVNDSSVTIQWNPGVSSDVAQQKIVRKKYPSENWETIAQVGSRDSVYHDTKTVPGIHYEYAIETIDSSGLSSGRSFGLKVVTYENGYKDEIKDFEVIYIQDKNKVSLKWKAPKGDISYYILYSARGNAGMSMTGNIKGNMLSYEESTSEGNYKYAIKAIYNNGSESALSEIKTVIVP